MTWDKLQFTLTQNLRYVRIVTSTSTNNARRQAKGRYDYAILRRQISPQDYQIYFIHIQITSNADTCNLSSAMWANVRATHSTLFYGIKGERKHL